VPSGAYRQGIPNRRRSNSRAFSERGIGLPNCHVAGETLSSSAAPLFGTARQACNSPVLMTPWQTISQASLIEKAPVSCTNGPGSRTKSLRSFGSVPLPYKGAPEVGIRWLDAKADDLPSIIVDVAAAHHGRDRRGESAVVQHAGLPGPTAPTTNAVSEDPHAGWTSSVPLLCCMPPTATPLQSAF